jgi:hypothetical protein
MPLMDHFHPPLSALRHWESFYAAWMAALADTLNTQCLPSPFFAEEQVRPGPGEETDFAILEKVSLGSINLNSSANGSPTNPPWAPPAPPLVLPVPFADVFEVLVYSTEGGPSLAAAIELVCPSNKGRSEHRRALAVKCVSYLCQGVGLILVDVVTNRQANLHNEMMRLLDATQPFHLPAEAAQYAVAYRPVRCRGKERIELWPETFGAGDALPTLPLALTGELCVPVDLEATYLDACKRRRLT